MRKIYLDDMFFKPQSVAIVGASEREGSVGSGLCKSISKEFQGAVYCVNPMYESLWGKICYHSLLDLPQKVSHAVIAVPRGVVLTYVHQCVRCGIANVVVVSAGFKEMDEEGERLEKELARISQENDIRLLGPNTLGFINTWVGFNGTFLPEHFEKGNVSVISQSGGIGMAVLAALKDQCCGISKWIGIGNEAVLDIAEILNYLDTDPQTKVIGVCFEGMQEAGEFLRTAKTVCLHKPIVVLRDGNSRTGMQAAVSHTGAMAQKGEVMKDLLEQAGVIQAESSGQCAVMLKALSVGVRPGGKRVAILTNTVGPSILATDILETAGALFPQPSQVLQNRVNLESGLKLQLGNPIDLSSAALNPENYGTAARCLLESGEYDLVLAFFSNNVHLKIPDQELIRARQEWGKTLIACFLSSREEFTKYSRLPEEVGIPCYCTPEDGANGAVALLLWGEKMRRPCTKRRLNLAEERKERVYEFLPKGDRVENTVLLERDSKRLLNLTGFFCQVPEIALDVEETVCLAVRLGLPVVIKGHSPKLIHKSDKDAVRLNLKTEEEVRFAAEEVLSRIRKLDEKANLSVQSMCDDGFDLILGATRLGEKDTLLMVGQGGIYSEVYKDVVFRMAPLCEEEPERMLEELRCAPIIDGYRGRKLDKRAVIEGIRNLESLMESVPQIKEIDINPLRVYEVGTEILDARIVVK